MNENEKLILIDGNSLINRAFYATPLLLAKDGTPTNAVYGFINMLFKLLKDEKPTRLSVAFDVHAPTFRHKMCDTYKGTRKPMPLELVSQVQLLKDVLKIMNIDILEKAGYEADDIIGTVAKSTSMPTIIITGDRDSFQLVDEETTVYFTKRGISDIDVLTNANFFEKTSLTPLQIIEYKAIAGDSSDNIPGIRGLGEKTAMTLLTKYKTLENIYENIEDLSGKLKEKIVCGKDSAFLSKQLATIDTHAEIHFNLEKMSVKTPFSGEVRKKFVELDFKGLLRRAEMFEEVENRDEVQLNTLSETSAPENSHNEQEESKALEPKKEEYKITTVIVKTEAALAPALESDALALSYGAKLAVFTGGIEYSVAERITLFDEGLSADEFFAALKNYLGNKDKTVYLYNLKDFRHFLKNQGIELNCKVEDVSIMKYLADFTTRDESLNDVIFERGLNKETPAAAVYILYNELKNIIQKDGMERLYNEVELPLSTVLYDMEECGFKGDICALQKLSEKYETELKSTAAKVYEMAGVGVFNINSPKQLGEVLFEKLHLGKGKKTKSGYSTSADALESLADTNEIVPLILRYRKLQKFKSTYADGLQAVADKKTGFIHTKFNQLVTTTGRLSSTEPNLQNIPIRDEESVELRRCLVASDEDHVLVGADYSQIELRLLAAFSGCKGLTEAFLRGDDIHSITASKVFGVPLDKVSKQMRRSAKAVNFGIIYGISEYGLAKDLKISSAEAKNYMSAYFEQYPEVKTYMEKNVALAKENGFVTTLYGRRRLIRELNSSNYMMRQFGERAAMNMPLQGSAADIIKVAMINVHNRLKEKGLQSRLILQVHDELIIDALKSEKNVVEKLLQEEMEHAVTLSVPLSVEVECGDSLAME